MCIRDRKIYRTHSGWVGGLKETPYRILMQEKPDVAMRVAVKGLSLIHIFAADLFPLCVAVFGTVRPPRRIPY